MQDFPQNVTETMPSAADASSRSLVADAPGGQGEPTDEMLIQLGQAYREVIADPEQRQEFLQRLAQSVPDSGAAPSAHVPNDFQSALSELRKEIAEALDLVRPFAEDHHRSVQKAQLVQDISTQLGREIPWSEIESAVQSTGLAHNPLAAILLEEKTQRVSQPITPSGGRSSEYTPGQPLSGTEAVALAEQALFGVGSP